MITYDSQGRAYWNGKRVPRVTEICQLLAPRFYTDEYYLRRGRLIHLVTQWDDSGELDESSVDPNLTGYLESYRKMKKEMKWVPSVREFPFYSEKYGFCGRLDALGKFMQWKTWNWILDIKSGQPHESDNYQGPAYLFGSKGSGIEAQKCADLYLRADGTYRFREIKNPTGIFIQFLVGLKKWREENEN